MADDDDEGLTPKGLPEYTDLQLERAGSHGRFQRWCTVLLCLPKVFVGMQTMVHVFTAMPAERRRVCPPGAEQCDLVPLREDECALPREGYEFLEPGSSVVADFGLVCDDSLKVPLLGSVFFFGFMFGVTFWSAWADSRGRRSAWSCALFTVQVGGLIAVLAPSYTAYVVARFVTGFGIGGLGLCTFLWNAEILAPEMRSALIVTSNCCFACGVALLSPTSYWLTPWRQLSGFIFIAGWPLFGIRYLVPESPRWLATKGDATPLYQVLCVVAAANGCSAPPPPPMQRQISRSQEQVTVIQTLRQLVCDSRLTRRFLVMCFTWISVSLGYYGISMNVANLGSSIYTASAMSALVELPASVGAFFAVESAWAGRRGSTGAGLMICGLCCVLSTFVVGPEGTAGEALLLLVYTGKFSIALAFASIYLYSAELFPTDIRARSMGLQSLAARIGSMLSPIVADVGTTSPALPFICFGLPCILAGLLQVGLPETRGRPLHGSVEELLPPESWPCTASLERCRHRYHIAEGDAQQEPDAHPAPERIGKAMRVSSGLIACD